MFDGYTHARMPICAADFKQMETIVDHNVSGAPAFVACMRWIVSVHCVCTRVCAEWLYWVQALGTCDQRARRH